MPFFRNALLAAATAGTLAAAGPARAIAVDFYATMDWTGTLFSLVDLTPADSVAPSFSWTSQTTGVSVLGSGTGGTVPDWISSLTASSSFLTASANASETRLEGVGITPAAGFLEANADRFGGFTLGAGTKVTFSIPASVTVGSPAGVDLLVNALIYVVGPSGASLDPATLAPGMGNTGSTVLSVSLSNDGPDNIAGHFSTHLGVNASPALAVPEPESYAMLLAGLGLVGGIALRRRRAR